MTSNILFCGDASMTDGVLIATLSLMRQTRHPLHIFILTATLTVKGHHYQPFAAETAERMAKLMQAQNPEHQLTRIDITEQFLANPPLANMGTMFTPYCMLRLYADLVPELPDRVLYLDTDVICRRPFDAFYNQSMTDVDIAGVLDHYGKWWFHHRLAWFDYLNSGVLLMNLAHIREDGLLVRCRRLVRHRWLFMPDQSALNIKLNSNESCRKNITNNISLNRIPSFNISRLFFVSGHIFGLSPSSLGRFRRCISSWDCMNMMIC